LPLGAIIGGRLRLSLQRDNIPVVKRLYRKGMAKKTKTTTKKVAKKATAQGGKKTKTKVIPPTVPVLATKEGMKLLKHHCEGIMELVGDLIVTNNPKISQKDFQTEAHGLIRIFFGMEKQTAKKTARR
jgi:hypothetical protein